MRLLPVFSSLFGAMLACNRPHLVTRSTPDASPQETASSTPLPAITLLSPQSTSLATTQTPTLRYHLSSGLSAARVEVCSDRGCGDVRWSSNASEVSSGVTVNLPIGPSFWRVRARASDGGEVSSATWVFRIARRSAGVDTSWLQGWDSNGDGFDDMPAGWFGAYALGTAAVAQARSQTAALDGSPCSYDMARPQCLALGDLRPAGDVDGDGFADALAPVAFDGPFRSPDAGAAAVEAHVLLFRGRVAGGPAPTGSSVCADMTDVVALGDIDGDGYADVAVRCGQRWRIYRGSEHGLLETADSPQAPVVAALDVNADGLADVLTGDGLRLGARGGLDPATSVAPMPAEEVVGAVARAGAEVDFAARVAGHLTLWHAAPGEVSHPVASSFAAPSVGERDIVAIVGDVDGDGFDDAAGGYDDGDGTGGWVRVLPGGPHAPQEPRLRWIKDPLVIFRNPVAVGDVNGDGFADLEVLAAFDAALYGHLYLGGPRGVAMKPTVTLDVHRHP
jgi:hypothetical protein